MNIKVKTTAQGTLVNLIYPNDSENDTSESTDSNYEVVFSDVNLEQNWRVQLGLGAGTDRILTVSGELE